MSKESVAPTPAKSLVDKLAEACDAVGGIDKKGHNERQNYKYVKAADVAKAFRHQLFKRGVILEANEKSLEERDVETNSGNFMRYVKLTVEYSLRDNSGVLGPYTHHATAMDSGDKAAYKAKTGCQKYFLRGLGLIPDEKDDPEADTKVDEYTEPKLAKALARSEKKQDQSTRQIAAFNSACKSNDRTDAQKTIYLMKRWNRGSAADLTPEELEIAIKWATGTLEEDIAQTVEFINTKKRKSAQPAVIAAEAIRQDEPEVAGD